MLGFTPPPQVRAPLETEQLPLDVDIVKLEVVPDKVYVAGVWTDQVPAVSKPPVLGSRCALTGRLPCGEFNKLSSRNTLSTLTGVPVGVELPLCNVL